MPNPQVAYSITTDSLHAVRCFASKRAAQRSGNGHIIFSNAEELASSRLPDDVAKHVFEKITRSKASNWSRPVLAKRLFNAIESADLSVIDDGMPEKEEQPQKAAPQKSVTPQKSPAPKAKAASRREQMKMLGDAVAEEKSVERQPREHKADIESDNAMKAYGVRPNSNRAKLLQRLNKSFGSQVGIDALVRAVYGDGSEESRRSPFFNVMKGLFYIQETHPIKFEVRKTSDEKGLHYGLYSRG